MSLSPDTIINIIFGTIMVIIGLVGIWIVKWSTDHMTAATAAATASTAAQSSSHPEFHLDLESGIVAASEMIGSRSNDSLTMTRQEPDPMTRNQSTANNTESQLQRKDSTLSLQSTRSSSTW